MKMLANIMFYFKAYISCNIYIHAGHIQDLQVTISPIVGQAYYIKYVYSCLWHFEKTIVHGGRFVSHPVEKTKVTCRAAAPD